MLNSDRILSLPRVAKGNAENFSLSEFTSLTGRNLLERVGPFSKYFREITARNQALYAREIVGPCKNRSRVRDLVTGDVREMVMLGSNNYLGLTTHPKVCEAVKTAVSEFGTGMAGPPLLNGMGSLHRKLERRLALLKGGCDQEFDALLFGSGYQANIGWMKALLKKGDVLLYDELNHASLFDGIALCNRESNCFASYSFPHNDVQMLESFLEEATKQSSGMIFVAIEGVYSMDGDIAPLPQIYELCKRYHAVLMMDDAHGTGIMGKSGLGTEDHFEMKGCVDIALGTFSKTFGATGGFIVAKREIIDYLRFFSRSYVFSAHLPPSTVASVLAGFDVIAEQPELIQRVHENAVYLQSGLNELGFQIKREAAILPILIRPELDIRKISRRIHEEGVFLNSIEYPAVAKHEQRLRLSVMATHTKDDLDFTIAVFKSIKNEFSL